jgi:glycosyltransferase involved in cell wall biosynthesis
MNSSPRNVLLVIPCFGFGGAQQVFHDHSVELSSRFKVTECVFNLDLPDVYPSGNQVVSLQVEPAAGLSGKLNSFWQRMQRLRRIKREQRTDISISHLEGADYVNLLSRVGERTIAVIHGSKVHDDSMVGWTGWLRQRILLPFIYRLPDHIVTVSRELRQELIGAYGISADRVTVINNFFYPEQILAKAHEAIEPQYEALFNAPRVMVTSGRFAPQKNQAPLLDVFAALLREQPGSKLVFLGDGDLRDKLVTQALGLGLRLYQAWNNDPLDQEYDVYMLGFQKNPFKYIRRAALFVFPSEWEGFPLALCEAMICGTPVITTDCPTGPREILAPTTPPTKVAAATEWADYGVLMPLLNADFRQQALAEWVTTLKQLLADGEKRAHYARQGEKRMQDFTAEKMFSKWLTVIDQVLAKK